MALDPKVEEKWQNGAMLFSVAAIAAAAMFGIKDCHCGDSSKNVAPDEDTPKVAPYNDARELVVEAKPRLPTQPATVAANRFEM